MHREHAIVEQAFASLEDSSLSHLPSEKFTAKAAWLTLAATAINLTRAAGHLASVFIPKRGPERSPRLINIPARVADRHRRLPPHPPPAATLVLDRRLHRPVGRDRPAHAHLNHVMQLPAHDPKDLGDPAPDAPGHHRCPHPEETPRSQKMMAHARSSREWAPIGVLKARPEPCVRFRPLSMGEDFLP